MINLLENAMVFSDRAEELGFKALFLSLACRLSRRTEGMTALTCECAAALPSLDFGRGFWTHDRACAVTRFVALFGVDEDRSAMVDGAHAFAQWIVDGAHAFAQWIESVADLRTAPYEEVVAARRLRGDE